ncbi:MAG: hypothetical protein KY475_10130, partial [Planctomycetes bacterium]|nr:hypothetical protein [Planctomycetota bacterium]
GMIERHWNRSSLAGEFQRYAALVEQELDLIDELVSGCYLAMADFHLFTSFSMLYFAAATTYEQRRLGGEISPGGGFLCADDEQLRAIVRQTRRRLEGALAQGEGALSSERFRQDVMQAIAPFDNVGLRDPSACNMYRYTAPIIR